MSLREGGYFTAEDGCFAEVEEDAGCEDRVHDALQGGEEGGVAVLWRGEWRT